MANLTQRWQNRERLYARLWRLMQQTKQQIADRQARKAIAQQAARRAKQREWEQKILNQIAQAVGDVELKIDDNGKISAKGGVSTGGGKPPR